MCRRRNCPPPALRLLLILTAFALPAAASAECTARGATGATLLFPYLEVDLADPQGRTTLISIQNTSGETVLTNVVLWTNCAFPAFSFNLVIEAHGVRSIDVRKLVGDGSVPASGEGTPFADCGVPPSHPGLGETELLRLQALLTGQPDPQDGFCRAALDPSGLVVGYMTADVMKECSDSIRTPLDEGYFTRDDVEGLAGSDNVLWGDFFLIDGEGNLAQGFEAVALAADGMVPEDPYGGFYLAGDDRQQLGSRYRARFFRGGAFDGSTEFLIWMAPQPYYGTAYCESTSCALGFGAYNADVLARKESGEQIAHQAVFFETITSRVELGGEELPIEGRFGSLEFELFYWGCKSGKCSPPGRDPVQGWLTPIYTAEGRFSVGVNAAAPDASCSE